MPRIIPNLWFDTEALEAAEFYVSIFPNARITDLTRYPEGAGGEPGTVLTVTFELDGTTFTALNGGPQYSFDEAVSFLVECRDQDEVDYFWAKLLAGGGQEGRCGWLKDRYGLSWQVVPRGLEDLLDHGDPERARRAAEALMTMTRIDVGALVAAADGA